MNFFLELQEAKMLIGKIFYLVYKRKKIDKMMTMLLMMTVATTMTTVTTTTTTTTTTITITTTKIQEEEDIDVDVDVGVGVGVGDNVEDEVGAATEEKDDINNINDDEEYDYNNKLQ